MSSSISESERESETSPTLPSARFTGRAFSRTFVHLGKRLRAVPSKKYMKKLVEAGRVKELAFTKRSSSADIKNLILANFPTLVGLDTSG